MINGNYICNRLYYYFAKLYVGLFFSCSTHMNLEKKLICTFDSPQWGLYLTFSLFTFKLICGDEWHVTGS